MKNIIFYTFAFIIMQFKTQAQCNVLVNANTINVQNDTTVVIPNSNYVPNFYLPCKTLKVDSAITVIDTIYLRAGTIFIADSLSTLWGGWVIYSEPGSIIDMNFKNYIALYYTSGSILIDTPANSSFAKIFCNNIIFNYSNMIASHTCSAPLNVIQLSNKNNFSVNYASTYWQVNNSTNQNTECTLYNLLGQKLTNTVSNNTTINIANENLPSGIYILQMKQGHQKYTEKVIKN